MKYSAADIKMIAINKIFLDQDNPRHGALDDQEQVIKQLCSDEQVLKLAQDIAENGINPLEIFALLPGRGSTYVVAEGNRRVCALKLLNDSDLAPTSQKTKFETLRSRNNYLELPAIVFERRSDVKLWLSRIHNGQDGGRGRKPWNAEQKQRHFGASKNAMAQAVLDYGEKLGFISAEERKGRISTVERYVKNPIVRGTLGVSENKGEIIFENSQKYHKHALRIFLYNVAEKNFTTRDNKDKIVHEARKINNEARRLEGDGGSKPLNASTGSKASSLTGAKPEKIKPKRRLKYDDSVYRKLEDVDNFKLSSIYMSLTSIDLKDNVPILTIGVWTLIESMTALCGRDPNTNFFLYLSPSRLEEIGLGPRNSTKGMRSVIERLSKNGNVTKHDSDAAAFNDQQLYNNFEVINQLIFALSLHLLPTE